MARKTDREPLDPTVADLRPPDQPPSRLPRLRLSWLAGARSSVLARCPSEVHFYNRLGLAVLLIASASGISWCIAAGYVLGKPPKNYWLLGVFVIVVVLTLEQLILGTPILRRRWWASLPQLSLRILLSIAIAVVISEPLLLRVNADAIDRKLEEAAQLDIRESEKTIREDLGPRISAAQDEILAIRSAQAKLRERAEHFRFLSDCEQWDTTCSVSGRLTCGPRCRSFARRASELESRLNNRLEDDRRRIGTLEETIRDLEERQRTQLQTARRTIDENRGIWAREEALWQITQEDSRAAIYVWLLRAMFLLFDLLPVTTRIARSLSSDQPYDMIADAERESELVPAAQVRAWAQRMRTRIDLQLRMHQAIDKAAYEAERDRRIAEILDEPGDDPVPAPAPDEDGAIPLTPQLEAMLTAAEARGRDRAAKSLADHQAREGELAKAVAKMTQRAQAAEQMLQRTRPLHPDYDYQSVIGVGSIGEVWRAIRKDGHPVAIKRLRRELAADADSIKRMKREARKRLPHPNIVAVLTSFEDDEGRPNIVMELVEGQSLRERLDEQVARTGRGFEPRVAVPWIVQSAAGLDFAHERKIVHRDFKPANILIDEHNQARVADFGIAAGLDSATATRIAGTWNYASPEQLRGERLTPQSDVYSLALVTYELLAGKRLFDFSGFAEAAAASRQLPLPKSIRRRAPAISTALARVILSALAEDPKDRPASAGDFARQLQVAMALGTTRRATAATAASEAKTVELPAQGRPVDELTTGLIERVQEA